MYGFCFTFYIYKQVYIKIGIYKYVYIIRCIKNPLCLVEVRNFCQVGIFPKMLQVIKLSYLWLEDVYKNINEVDGYPLVVSQTCNICWLLAQVLAAEIAY